MANAITVNNLGVWKPLSSLQEYEKADKNRLCDMDKVAVAVLRETQDCGYTIKTSLENFCLLLNASLEDNNYTDMGGGISGDFDSTVKQITDYLYDQRGHFNEFDYLA